MRTAPALLLPLLVSLTGLTGACVVTQAPPSSSEAQPSPPPGQTSPPATATAPPPATTPTTAPPSTGTAGTPGAPPATLIGAWSSPSCGARTYARKIQFERTSNFEAHDLVSPCPPKVQCIWSGIVDTRGTYTVESATIKLTVAQPPPQKGQQPLPQALSMDPASGAPVEMSPDGKRCVYTKDTGTN